MNAILTAMGLGLTLTGCKDIQREQINIEVDADVPFAHAEPFFERLEGHYLEEIDVPSGVTIGYPEDVLADEAILISGTVAAGEYDFELRFTHYGDVPRLQYTYWSVSLIAD